MQRNHSNTDSGLHLNRLPPPKIFISLFLSAFLTSREVRETSYKSDPGPLGVDGKNDGMFLPLPLLTDLVLPSPTQTSFLCLCFFPPVTVRLCFRLNMLSKMLVHMCHNTHSENTVCPPTHCSYYRTLCMHTQAYKHTIDRNRHTLSMYANIWTCIFYVYICI